MQIQKLLAAYGTPLLLGAFFATCSFAVCPLGDAFHPMETGALLVYTCIGVIGAAAALVAAGGVLWPREFAIRMLISFALGVFLFGCWLIGFTISAGGSSSAEDVWRLCTLVLLCLPLVFLAIQSPLWLTRLVFRWNVISISQATESPTIRPLTIRDMLTAMGLIGLGLAGARFALAEQNGSLPEEAFWLRTAALLASCVGISLASTLPIVFATLRARKRAFAILGIGIYTAIALAITFTVIGFINRASPRLWDMIVMSTTVVTFTGAMSIPLLIARQRGFRLRWGRESVGQLETTAEE